MRQLLWMPRALRDVDALVVYLAQQNEKAADIIAQRLLDAAESLTKRPTGRPGRVDGTYEKSVAKTSYVIAYSLTETQISILRIIHVARNWPPDAWPRD